MTNTWLPSNAYIRETYDYYVATIQHIHTSSPAHVLCPNNSSSSPSSSLSHKPVHTKFSPLTLFQEASLAESAQRPETLLDFFDSIDFLL